MSAYKQIGKFTRLNRNIDLPVQLKFDESIYVDNDITENDLSFRLSKPYVLNDFNDPDKNNIKEVHIVAGLDHADIIALVYPKTPGN